MDNEFKLKNGSGCLYCKGCGRQDKQLNTYDWLADIPGNAEEQEMVEVQFKNTGRGYFKNSNKLKLDKGDIVAVEASPGHDIGVVTLTGRLVPLQMRKANLKPDVEIKRIYRKVKPVDMEKYEEAKAKEHDTMIRSRQIALNLNLNMKIGDVEYQGDVPCTHRDETNRCTAGSRAHRRYRSLRPRTVLRYMDDKLCLCFHQCRPLSGYFTQPAEVGRTMRQAEVLPQL